MFPRSASYWRCCTKRFSAARGESAAAVKGDHRQRWPSDEFTGAAVAAAAAVAATKIKSGLGQFWEEKLDGDDDGDHHQQQQF